MIKAGANINAKSRNCYRPLKLATKFNKDPSIIYTLKNSGAEDPWWEWSWCRTGYGFAKFGASEDPVSKFFLGKMAVAGEWLNTKYPKTTQQVSNVIAKINDKTNDVLTYMDDATGNIVSKKWNSIPEYTRYQIKGILILGTAISGTYGVAKGSVGMTKGAVSFATFKGAENTVMKGIPSSLREKAVSKIDRVRGKTIYIGDTIIINRKIKNIDREIKDIKKEYEILNNPPANKTVKLPKDGIVFTTDELGRVIEIEFSPKIKDMDRNKKNQGEVRDEKGCPKGDVGGHIQACSLGGSGHKFNLIAQNKELNSGAYKSWENEIRRALKDGKKVEVKVKIEYKDPKFPKRPSELFIKYSVDGVKEDVTFPNPKPTRRVK